MFTTLCLVFTLLFYVQCKAIVIDSVDFQITQVRHHHTDEFYANEKGLSHVVLRRGADFRFKTIFRKGHSDARISVKLSFATKKDKMIIDLPSNLRNGWHLTQSRSAHGINFVLHIPGNAPVGIWRMHLIVKNKKGAIIENRHIRHKIVVLFNAWSKEDPAYFKDEHKLKEYVLAESGHLYFYDWETYDYMQWIFGQFQPQILDSILFILDRSNLSARERGDIVKVTRTLTHLLNYGRGQSGVLLGRWRPPFEIDLFGHRTTDPSEWTGSVAILRQYYETNGTPVGFGQCWVYAGILTTAYRALGIASRPIANFASAHDRGHDLTLDTYLDINGNVIESKSETFWNFHEWVQAWFRRDDLGLKYGEWQNLDATPQALHDGYLQVGPASRSSIFNARLRNKYETEYLYSEVNADQVVWSHDKQIVEINPSSVGLAVVTKAFDREAKEDITYLFKPTEGTKAERDSYKAAAKSLGKTPVSLRNEIRGRSQRTKKLSLSITPLAKVKVGSTINIEVLLQSKYSENKQVTVILKASSIFYHGEVNALIKNETRRITIPALRQGKAVFTIQSKDYIKLLTSKRTILIEAVVLLEKQIHRVVRRVSLKTSKLEIIAPKGVNYNSKFNLTVKFKNPLNHTLRNCRIAVEGKGIKRKVVKLSDRTALATGNIPLEMSSKYCGLETVVISLYSDLLKEIAGHVQLNVKGKKTNVFAMFNKKKPRVPSDAYVDESLPHKGVDANFESEQNQNVTTDEFTCCTLVTF